MQERHALELGAVEFVSKDFALEELALAPRTVAAGRVYLRADIALAAVNAPGAAPGPTPRPCDVPRVMARGHSNKLIARDLGVSVKTVECHRAELILRLDLDDVASLTRHAVTHGLAHWYLESARERNHRAVAASGRR